MPVIYVDFRDEPQTMKEALQRLFRSLLFRAFLVEIVGYGYLFPVDNHSYFKPISFFKFIARQEFVGDGLTMFLAPFEQLTFIVVVEVL